MYNNNHILYTTYRHTMAETIIDGTLFNAKNVVKYSAPKANASGGKSINILNNKTNMGLRLSTPLMLTWGASDFQDPQTGKGNGKFEMSLQFPSSEYQTEDTSVFLANMIRFEQKIKDDALTSSKDWFGKAHKNAEVIEALYTPMLKYCRDKATGEPDLNKSPTLRIKIPAWEGVFKCEVYDEDGAKLFPDPMNPANTPMDFIKKGSQVAALIQCGGIWFANGKFGVTWKLVQVVVQKPKGNLTGQCFIKLNSSDKDKLKSCPAVEDVCVDYDNSVPSCSKSAVVCDSDVEEEEVEDDEVEEEPVYPPPTPPTPPEVKVEEVVVPPVVEQPAAAVVKKTVVKKKLSTTSN